MIRYAGVALVLLLPACGSDGTSAGPSGSATPSPGATSVATSASAVPSPTDDDRIRVVVAGGKVVERPGARVEVKRGERVRIEVVSDVSDEVHVHTYDLKAGVAPGAPALLDFVASIPGVIEVELEDQHLLLFKLEVR